LNSEDLNLLQNYKLLNEDDKKIVAELIQLLNKHRRKRHIE